MTKQLLKSSLWLALALCALACTEDNDKPAPDNGGEPHMYLNKSDSLALVSMYHKAGPWAGKWDLHDITTWTGVATAYDLDTQQLRVVGFEVCQGSFWGVFPEEVCQLTELRRLAISGGTMTGSIPDSIGKLKHLNCFKLEERFMTGSIPESIGELTELTELNISHTPLTGSVPESIGNLVNLERLIITETEISGEVPKGIANMDKLRYVWLSDNHFTGRIPIEILKRRISLPLYNNDITELPFEVWRDDNSLTPPCLQGNRLSGEIPEWVFSTEKWAKDGSYCTIRQQKGYGYSNVKDGEE